MLRLPIWILMVLVAASCNGESFCDAYENALCDLFVECGSFNSRSACSDALSDDRDTCEKRMKAFDQGCSKSSTQCFQSADGDQCIEQISDSSCGYLRDLSSCQFALFGTTQQTCVFACF